MLKRENDFAYYRSASEYKPKPVKPLLSKFGDSSEAAFKFAEALKEYEKMLADWNDYHKKILKEEQDKERLFQHDMEEEYGTANYPEKVREALYSKAYAHGHSSGFGEIENWYSEFTDIADVAMAEK